MSKRHRDDDAMPADTPDTRAPNDDAEYSRQMILQREASRLACDDAQKHRLVSVKERVVAESAPAADEPFVKRLMVGKYRHFLHGQVLMKDAVSLSQYQMLIAVLRPGTIFDLGTCGGGAALWFGAWLKGLELHSSTVVTCDIVDRREAACCARMAKEGSNVRFCLCDLTEGEAMFATLTAQGIELPHPWLIAEDCHLDAEILLKTFEPRMRPGDYIVFEDTNPSHPDDVMVVAEGADRAAEEAAWTQARAGGGKFAREKYAKMAEAMDKRGGAFAVDATIQDLCGYNGSSFVNSVFVKTGQKKCLAS